MTKECNLEGCTILIADDSIVARGIFSTYVNRAKGKAIVTKSAKEALAIINEQKVDLLITDINMPEMNGFELMSEIAKSGKKIPHIMLTTADIDEYINLAIEKDVGNILTKEISEADFIRTCHNFITRENIFGLKHYIPGVAKIIKLQVNNSRLINAAIKKLCGFAIENGMPSDQQPFLSVILDEILSNAVYHAHGYSEEKVNRQMVELNGDEVVEVCYGRNDLHLGISVTDYEGKLTKKTILSAFKNVVNQKKLMEESEKMNIDFVVDKLTTDGRGLQMIRLMANNYFFNIKKGEMTQVIVLVNISKDAMIYHNASIRINEVV